MKNPNLNLIIMTKEKYGDAGVALTEHLEDRIGVAFDDNGRTFRYFGVKFIPFCVIRDKKGQRGQCTSDSAGFQGCPCLCKPHLSDQAG